MPTVSFPYTDEELDRLKRKDVRLARAIGQIGRVERGMTPDLFLALAESVISQQISNKAAETVCRRARELCEPFSPTAVAALPPESLQSCGMSLKKAGYIQGIARQVASGALDLDSLSRQTDAEVIRRLTELNGIGVWTAEMMLIFSLGRRDVFSFGDLGIRRGLMMLHRHTSMDKERFERYRRRYSPYGSIASLYLWHISTNGVPEEVH